jgi:2-succinyl-5-enolpyruvyl-6-hydroxy-3-cyclohexene-1-carboxylate synthase
MNPADLALAAMSAFVDGLVDGGVRHASVSPGSRSTPLALALARHPNVRVHVQLDERSSGFFALGLSRVTGAPVAIACTSGTAAANLLPALVEASMTRVPLVALTADRPPELRGVGANQTIEQAELYGRYVRAFIEAPVPSDAPSLEGWRSRGLDAVRRARTGVGGPVHVNVPFRDPLVPGVGFEHGTRRAGEDLAEGHALAVGDVLAAGHALAEGDVMGRSGRSGDVVPLLEAVRGVRRGLVYAGGLRSGGAEVSAIADALRWPLVAEPHSGARGRGALRGGQLLVRSDGFVDAHVPDVVLQIGAAPTSRAALALVGRSPRLVILDPDDLVADPLRRASRRVVAEPAALLPRLVEAEPRHDDDWLATWHDASERARAAVDALLDGWDEPFEGRVARDVADATPAGGVLCVGSSLPIRDLDLYMRPRDEIAVLANRGASGIDGFVSTTLGAAGAGSPTVGLLGDLTLLHDVGALVWNAPRGVSATLVVLDNGGGAIFSTLEQRSLPELEELFTTPHRADIGAIARAAGAGHTVVDRAGDLDAAVRRACEFAGIQVVQVRIDPERDGRRRDEVDAVLEEALA